ncbi:MAG: hypothetical protein LR015_11145 [Verrucomicrobia bacterium]|nr:hypothetical protein [Verrucomicrobiota bacterium]
MSLHLIGLITCQGADYMVPAELGAVQAAHDCGVPLQIFAFPGNSSYSEMSLLDAEQRMLLKLEDLSGLIIIFPGSRLLEDLARLRETKPIPPIALVGRQSDIFHGYTADGLSGMHEATSFLLKSGHRRIVFFG